MDDLPFDRMESIPVDRFEGVLFLRKNKNKCGRVSDQFWTGVYDKEYLTTKGIRILMRLSAFFYCLTDLSLLKWN